MKPFWFFGAILFLVFSLPLAQSSVWKVLVIESVDDSRTIFTTRTEPEDDPVPGRRGSFTTQYASIAAKTIDVGKEFTRWKVINPYATIPFNIKDKVIYSPSLKSLWPQSTRQKPSPPGELTKADCEIQSTFEKHFKPKDRKAFKSSRKKKGIRFRFSAGRGINEIVSNVSATTYSTRSQTQREFTYFQQLGSGVVGSLGIRLDQEESRISVGSIDSIRQYLVMDVRWNLDKIPSLPYKLSTFTGISLGAGLSSSRVNLQRHKGFSFIFPSFFLGLSRELSSQWRGNLEGGLEFIFIKEKIGDEFVQKSSQLNGSLGLSLSRSF